MLSLVLQLKQEKKSYVTDILLISLAMGDYNRVKGMCKVI